MSRKKDELYARLDSFHDLLVPMDLVEQIVTRGYMVRTGYGDNGVYIEELKRIEGMKFHEGEEVEMCLAQQRLEGES